MAMIKVHGFPISPPVRRVIVCLEEKGLPYDFLTVDMFSGNHKKQPFISINPFGQIPAIEDGHLKLYESRAITQYIAHGYASNGTPLIPTDPKELAIVILWAEIESQQFDPTASKLSFELVIKPIRGMTTDEIEVEKLQVKLAAVLDVYEARLSESKFLAGETFSLADLNHIPIVSNLYGTKIKALFEARPNLNLWAEDILGRPSWQKTLKKMTMKM